MIRFDKKSKYIKNKKWFLKIFQNIIKKYEIILNNFKFKKDEKRKIYYFYLL